VRSEGRLRPSDSVYTRRGYTDSVSRKPTPVSGSERGARRPIHPAPTSGRTLQRARSPSSRSEGALRAAAARAQGGALAIRAALAGPERLGGVVALSAWFADAAGPVAADKVNLLCCG
jgi:hypothetical protein